jgi:hypothetical protein
MATRSGMVTAAQQRSDPLARPSSAPLSASAVGGSRLLRIGAGDTNAEFMEMAHHKVKLGELMDFLPSRPGVRLRGANMSWFGNSPPSAASTLSREEQERDG